MKRYLNLIVVFSIAILTGCTTSGAFVATNQTNVNLEENNFSITANNVSGEAESGYLLGVSYSYGMLANTIAIARVAGTGELYSEALQNLWEKYEDEHGNIEGQNVALANVRYDTDILNLFLYTKVKVTIRADIVEFE